MGSLIYQALQSNEIRLLELAAGRYEDHLSIELKHVNLDSKPAFEALSYTWGTSAKQCLISCDAKSISITLNLKAALLRLREAHKSRTLWIDQICINQKDVQERNKQVTLMGTIYSRAYTVLVWIGEEDDQIRAAFGFLPILLSYLPQTSEDAPAQQKAKVRLPSAALPIVRSPSWEALSKVFSRPWFRRAWVIQEVALAKHAEVYCGDCTIDWQSLTRASSCQLGLQDAKDAHDSVEAITALRRSKNQNFANTLFLSYRFQCTDPRDKIYALLGFAKDGRDQIGSMLRPNYELSVEEIYLSAAKTLIACQGTLDVLCCVTHPKKRESLPSWVPDWESDLKVRRMLGASYLHISPNRGNTTSRFSEDSRTISVGGNIIGRITKLSATLPPAYKDSYDVMPDWEGFARQANSSAEGTYPTNYWRTLLAGYKFEAKDTEEQILRLWEAWDNVDARNRRKQTYKPSEHLDLENEMAAEFDAAMQETCIGRRLCLVGGSGLGLVPDGACKGDLVCDLDGGPVPFVIREIGEDRSYHLVGECYVQGYSRDQESFTDVLREERKITIH